MANKIGVVLALDGEQKFAQGMKSAQQSAKLLDAELKGLSQEYKGHANSLQALQAKQEVLNKKQEAYKRVLDQAKGGQKEAVQSYQKEKDELDKLTKAREKAQKALEKMNDSDEGYDDQKKSVEDLSRQVDKQVDAYLKAEKNLSSWDKKVSAASKNVKSNSDAIEKNEKYLNEASHSADKCASSIDAMGKEMKDAGKESDKMGDGLKDALSVMAGNLAANAVTALGNAAKDAGKYVLEVGSDFEATMSEVEALSGASSTEMKQMEDVAKNLGRTTKFSAKEVGQAFSYMSLAGWKTADMLSAIGGITDLAAAANMDLAEASDMVTDYLSAFGMEASEAVKMADMLAFAQANSNTSVQQLGEAYSNSAANMHAAGQDIETTTALLEAMANQGDKGATAGTGLAAVMADIAKQAKDGAVMIGDTAVQVMDVNGNYRDLTDIMRDVEKATKGMGTAERDAALKATFQKTSLKAVNEILTEGMDAIDGYEEALRNSDGAAADMANTMQANLKGAMATFGSAVDGLATEAYGYISGPATAIVNGAAEALNGLTDAITPHKTEMQEFIQTISDMNDTTAGELEKAENTVSDAEAEVTRLDGLAEIIRSANTEFGLFKDTDTSAIAENVEGTAERVTDAMESIQDTSDGSVTATNTTLSELDKKMNSFEFTKVRGAIEQLAAVIPEIGDAWDPVNGTLDMTITEFNQLIDVQKALAIQQAVLSAQNDLLQASADAALAQFMAQDAVDTILADINEAFGTNFTDADEALRVLSEDWNTLNFNEVGEVTKFGEDLAAANAELKEAEANSEAADKAYTETGEKMAEYADTLGGTIESQEILNDAMTGTGGAAGEAGEGIEKLSDKLKSVEDVARTSSDNIKEAWDSLVKSAKDSLGSINPMEAFNGGEVTSTFDMEKNLKSQVDGLKNYSENLEKLSEHIGKEVSPEFFNYIQDLGIGGAANLENLLKALESEDGAERVAQICQEYAEAMNMQDIIAQQMAGNNAVLNNALAELGSSSDAEFTALKQSIEKGVSGADDAMKQDLLDMAQTAQSIGATIPEGLTDAIQNQEVDAETIKAQLESSMQGAIDGLSQLVVDQGGEVPEGLAEGLEDGSKTFTDAYNELLSSLGEATGNESQMKETGKALVTDELVAGMNEAKEEVATAASDIATEAANAVSESAEAFTSAGTSSMDSYANGIKSGQSQPVVAASNVASNVASAIKAWENSFYNVGVNMDAGLARGIAGGASQAITAASNVARSALQAAKNALDIHSPSRKFRDEVGKQVSAGMAFGIKQNSKLATKEAETLASRTLYAAKKWVTKNGKNEANAFATAWDVLLDKELKKKQKNKKGDVVSGAFGVSWYKKDGKKQVKKTAEEYYNDILKAAETYFESANTLEQMDERQQLNYWTKISSSLKKGTKAWYDAQRKISDIKNDIGNFGTANNLLSTFESVFDVSETAEEQYWDIVRKLYKEGTEDRVNADLEYQKAHQKVLDKEMEVEEKFQEAVADATKTKEDSIKELAKEYSDAFGLFDDFESQSRTGEELLFAIQSQAEGIEFWVNQIDELTRKGILSKELIDEIKKKGPAEVAAVVALNSLDNEKLQQYQTAYDKRNEYAYNEAKKDEAINKAFKESINEAVRSRDEELGKLKTGISTDLQTLARSVNKITSQEADKIVAAVKGGYPAEQAVKDATNGAVNTQNGSSSGSGNTNTKTTTSTQSSTTSTTTTKSNTAIDNVMNSAPKRSKTVTKAEADSHGGLWEYLAKNYGIDGNTDVYKGLAKALGIKIAGDKLTADERSAILAALKKAGYAGGTRSLSDPFAWMDEAGFGSEMIIRRSDGARLNTNVMRGDAIVPAANTKNLYDWSELVPDDMLKTLAMQNAVVGELIGTMAKAVDVNGMNSSLSAGINGRSAKYGGSNNMLEAMVDLMNSYLPYLAQRTQVNVDGRKLVSATSDYTSANLAMRQRRNRF